MALGSAFFAVLGGAVCLRAVLSGSVSPKSLAVIVGSPAMAAAGLWLARRMSWPWSGPAVALSDQGLILRPARRNARVIPWHEITGVVLDSNGRVLFDVVDPARHPARLGPFRSRPHCPADLWNAEGEDFLIVLEEYWQAPG